MTTRNSRKNEPSGGTGEMMDRLPSEPPDEASDDPSVAICPSGQVMPPDGKWVETIRKMGILG